MPCPAPLTVPITVVTKQDDSKEVVVGYNLSKLAPAPSVMSKTHDIIIVGAGPAALTAAIYTTREDIDTLLFERGVVGGLAAITDKVDNYPGFPDGVEGLTLANNPRETGRAFGAKIEYGEVTAIHDEGAQNV